jgi:hypothetical protein
VSTTKKATSKYHTAQELKTLFEALNSAPSYLSKRFILLHMLGWDEDKLRLNMQLVEQEKDLARMGKTGI